VNRKYCDYITLELDVSQGHKLLVHFLVDSGADSSLVKRYKLLGTAEFAPNDMVRTKSVEGSVVETHGSIESRIWEGELDITFRFQLLSQQVDLKGKGVLGNKYRPKFATGNDP